jgi:dethiobiotin synthetase
LTETQTANKATTQKLPSVFITGTDTGVGKTVLAALLGLIYQEAGLNVAYFKPVETGAAANNGELVPGDTQFVAAVLGLNEPIDVLCPYCYEPPVSPHLAARLARKPVKPEVVEKCFNYLDRHYDAVIVEGTGGLLVPLRDGYMVADVAGSLGLPLIIAAHPGLGTLNHTFLTIASALRVDLALAGVVLGRYPENPGPAAKDNPKAIADFSGVPVLALVPEIPGLDLTRPQHALLKEAALKLNALYRLDEALAKLAPEETADVQS